MKHEIKPYGLFYYKLESEKYEGDISKNCKLTITDMDHNFFSLKSADFTGITTDLDSESGNTITFLRNDRKNPEIATINFTNKFDSLIKDSLYKTIALIRGESGLTSSDTSDFGSIAEDINVEYDNEEGSISINFKTTSFEEKSYQINDLITKHNLTSELYKGICESGSTISEIIGKTYRAFTDSTLIGDGSKCRPLGLKMTEMTGEYKPVLGILLNEEAEDIICTKGDVKKGDRYVVKSAANKNGYFYDKYAIDIIEKELIGSYSQWRIPTRDDWNILLNYTETWTEDANHSSSDVDEWLGRDAGKKMKKEDSWPAYSEDSSVTADNASQMSIVPTFDKYKINVNSDTILWTSSQNEMGQNYLKEFGYCSNGVKNQINDEDGKYSLRLVRDYNGSLCNGEDTSTERMESILGRNYNTKIFSENIACESGETIINQAWIIENFSFINDKILAPISGGTHYSLGDNSLYDKVVYYYYVWNGIYWDIKELNEGDEFVLKVPKKNEPINTSYTNNEKYSGLTQYVDSNAGDWEEEISGDTSTNIKYRIFIDRKGNEYLRSIENEIKTDINSLNKNLNILSNEVDELIRTKQVYEFVNSASVDMNVDEEQIDGETHKIVTSDIKLGKNHKQTDEDLIIEDAPDENENLIKIISGTTCTSEQRNGIYFDGNLDYGQF